MYSLIIIITIFIIFKILINWLVKTRIIQRETWQSSVSFLLFTVSCRLLSFSISSLAMMKIVMMVIRDYEDDYLYSIISTIIRTIPSLIKMRIVMVIILLNDVKWRRWQRWQYNDNNRSQNFSINKKTMMRTFSPPYLSSHPPTEPSICAALDVVPIQRCSLRLSNYDDEKF